MQECAGAAICAKDCTQQNGEWHLLVVFPRDRSKFPGFPKGKIKKSETIWQAVLRETYEETGVTVSPSAQFLGAQTCGNGNKIINLYFDIQPMPQNGKCKPKEKQTKKAKFIPISQLPENFHPDQKSLLALVISKLAQS